MAAEQQKERHTSEEEEEDEVEGDKKEEKEATNKEAEEQAQATEEEAAAAGATEEEEEAIDTTPGTVQFGCYSDDGHFLLSMVMEVWLVVGSLFGCRCPCLCALCAVVTFTCFLLCLFFAPTRIIFMVFCVYV